MQYGMKLAAAGVWAALAGTVSAGSGVVPNWPNEDLWWSWKDGDNSSVAFFQEADAVSGDGSLLLIEGSGVVLGKGEDTWQSIRGVDQLRLQGRDITVFAAETELPDGLNVTGEVKWVGSPATLIHRVGVLSFDDVFEEGASNKLDLVSGFIATDSLEWNQKSCLTVHGYTPQFAGGTAGSGAVLAVKQIKPWNPTDSSLNVKLEGNSALVLGT